MKNRKIEVKGTEITVFNRGEKDYISLTDIARYRNTAEPFSVINNWMRAKKHDRFYRPMGRSEQSEF